MTDQLDSPGAAGSPFGSAGRGPRLLAGGGRQATVVSTVSTLVVLAALAALFLLAPGSSEVRHTFFDPRDMWQSFIGNPKAGYYSIGAAIWLNIRMFLAAELLILILALALALIRQSVSPVLFPLRVLGLAYVDFFRGVPTLLAILAVGLGIPALRLAGPARPPPSTAWPPWCCPTPPTSARSTGRAWARCTRASSPPPARWACPRARRSATSSCRRRSATSSRRCSTTSSACRRTRPWSACSARSRPTRRRRSTAVPCSTSPASRWPPSCS